MACYETLLSNCFHSACIFRCAPVSRGCNEHYPVMLIFGEEIINGTLGAVAGANPVIGLVKNILELAWRKLNWFTVQYRYSSTRAGYPPYIACIRLIRDESHNSSHLRR